MSRNHQPAGTGGGAAPEPAALRLPALGAVDRSRPPDPFVIDDPDGGLVGVVYGPFPGDPSPLLRPIAGGRCSGPGRHGTR